MIGPLPTAIANADAPACQGQVEVAEGVALGDRVVLTASPGCRLVLAPGVCLGHGVIIQAVRGDLVIEPGAVLGSGVLIVGAGRIGQNVCIGAESTLINPAIPARQMVPPNSLLGDPSRSAQIRSESWADSAPPVTGSPATSTVEGESLERGAEAWPETAATSTDDSTHASLPNLAQADEAVISETDSDATDPDATDPDNANNDATAANGTRPSPAHGQKQVKDLLATLFPHRQPLNGVSPEDKP